MVTDLKFQNIEKLDVNIISITETLKYNFPKSNVEKVKKAYEMSLAVHKEDFRESGEKYITHPLFVAYLCASIKLDESAVVAALLHDTVEDSQLSLDEIEKEYGFDVRFLVDGLTKINKVTDKIKDKHYDFASLRKLLIASTKDVRVIVIKLADRLHNMMTIISLSEERKRKNAIETLKFYAPLADFVGINFFRNKLEDYSFKALEPDIYNLISNYLAENKLLYNGKYITRDDFIPLYIEVFNNICVKNNINAQVFGRNKGIYSIYKKIIKKNNGIFDIKYIRNLRDLVGITILVNSIPECYKALGLIYSKYEHLPQFFKDYIAKPKDNGYRSIHAFLLDKDGVGLEAQIKTHKMHEYNEYGPAAHIYFKERESSQSAFKFLKKVVRWKDNVKDIEDYKVDVFRNKVFVFTPNGDVKELPLGATGIDFAYLIHTKIGNSCNGVKVNGAIKPLNYRLQTGDVIEVLINRKRYFPSSDWLSFAKTVRAQSNIRKFLRINNNLNGTNAPSIKEEMTGESREKLEFSEESQTSSVDGDKLEASSINERQYISEKISEAKLVDIKGIKNIDYSIAKCCSPIPGDDIIGHVTKTRGIKIHTKNCKELKEIEYKVLLEAGWIDKKTSFPVGLSIKAVKSDNTKFLRDISQLLGGMKINLEKMDTWTDHAFNANIMVSINSVNQLDLLIKKIKKIKGILNVERSKII